MPSIAIHGPGLPAESPKRLHYSPAVRNQSIVWVSGQVALKDDKVIGLGDIEAQAEQVFVNLRTALELAGGSLDDIVETTTYMTAREYGAAINEARKRHLTGSVPPTSTLIVVAGLARPELLVEISAVAVLE